MDVLYSSFPHNIIVIICHCDCEYYVVVRRKLQLFNGYDTHKYMYVQGTQHCVYLPHTFNNICLGAENMFFAFFSSPLEQQYYNVARIYCFGRVVDFFFFVIIH